MSDRREEILTRLMAVLEAIPGFASVMRNRSNVSESRRPYIAMYDGDEEANIDDPRPVNYRAVRRIDMRPDIVIFGMASPETVGTTVNSLRAQVVKAIYADTELASLTADGTGIRYDGMTNSLAQGRAINAELALQFTFSYYCRPDTL